MAKIQKWTAVLEGETHTVEYQPKGLFGKSKITIDGTTFPLLSKNEAFRLGESRAIITVGKGKKATVTLDGEVLEEN